MANLLEKIDDGSIYEQTNSVSLIIGEILDEFDKIVKEEGSKK